MTFGFGSTVGGLIGSLIDALEKSGALQKNPIDKMTEKPKTEEELKLAKILYDKKAETFKK